MPSRFAGLCTALVTLLSIPAALAQTPLAPVVEADERRQVRG